MLSMHAHRPRSTRAPTPPGRGAGHWASPGKSESLVGLGRVRGWGVASKPPSRRADGKGEPLGGWEGWGGGGGLASGEDGRPERQGETINVSRSIDEIEIMI